MIKKEDILNRKNELIKKFVKDILKLIDNVDFTQLSQGELNFLLISFAYMNELDKYSRFITEDDEAQVYNIILTHFQSHGWKLISLELFDWRCSKCCWYIRENGKNKFPLQGVHRGKLCIRFE